VLPVFSAFEPSALVERATETSEHVVFSVHADDDLRAAYRAPGQFVKMRVRSESSTTHEGIFAIASAPFEQKLAFLIRTNNPVGGEAADRIARMPIDAPIEITRPAGDGFAIHRAANRDLAIVAVGTAMAPIRSVVETLLHEPTLRPRSISIDYGLRSPLHLPFARDVDGWRSSGVSVALHVGEVRPDGSHVGPRAQDALFDHVDAKNLPVVIAVGPDALVAEVRARYAALGGDPADVLHNY
jgi:CDP-4-dehydro-6-deoxyglucose reductase